MKTEERLKEVGGNVDYVRFRHEVADRLIEGGDFEYRVYNCRTLSFDRTVYVKEKGLMLWRVFTVCTLHLLIFMILRFFEY